MKYIISNSSITFFHNGRPINIQKGSTKYAKILKAFDLQESKQDEAIKNVLNESKVFAEEAKKEGFEFKGDQVFIDGELLPQVLVDKINSLRKEGLPITLFLNFWRNLRMNPSYRSVNELYQFLENTGLPLTEDGCFLAYKGLQKNYWSISGNTKTNVLKGKVDFSGKIFNGIGEAIEVDRKDVDDNREIHCSSGLHASEITYSTNFAQGKLVVVKINPKDVVSVPSDYNCKKLRCCAYEVLCDVEKEILVPATDSRGKEIVDKAQTDLTAFEKRVQSYLDKKYTQGFTAVYVKQIRNSFSPEYPSEICVLAALNALGYVWIKEKRGSLWVALR
jgi:hypothetical protein